MKTRPCVLLALSFLVNAYGQTNTSAGPKATTTDQATDPAAAAVVTRYITAIGQRDWRTILDLSYANQDDIATIKAGNPQILWPKLTKEYYDAKLAAFPNNLTIGGLKLTNAKWTIAETRTSHVQDSINFGPYDRTIVYVLVDYASLEDSMLIGVTFLKQAILQFEVNAKSRLIMSIEKLPQGDVAFDAVPFMILNASWQAEGLGGGYFTAQTVGGKPPFSWRPQCGSVDFTKDIAKFDALGMPMPQNAPRLVVKLNAAFPNNLFPLRCTVTVTDGSGQTDTIAVAVPKMFTGFDAFCWARPPWVGRGQGLPSVRCLSPALSMDTAVSPSTGIQVQTANPTADSSVSLPTRPAESGGTWTDSNTGLMWATKDNGSDVTQRQASNYCRNLTLAGFKDWSLPEIGELVKLYDRSVVSGSYFDADTGNRSDLHVKGGIQMTGHSAWAAVRGNRPLAEAFYFNVVGRRGTLDVNLSSSFRALCVRHSSQ